MARAVLMAGDLRRSRRRRAALGPMLGSAARVDALEAVLRRRAQEWARAIDEDDGDGVTLLIWPELPVWQPAAGAAALSDLAAGCAASIGPVFDGALYLLAFAQPIPELTEPPAPTMARAFAVIEREGLEVGLLRAERGLCSPDDVRALRADPTTDAELSELLG